jgi:hypothetical protein
MVGHLPAFMNDGEMRAISGWLASLSSDKEEEVD